MNYYYSNGAYSFERVCGQASSQRQGEAGETKGQQSQRNYIDRLNAAVTPVAARRTTSVHDFTPTGHTAAPITHVVPNTAPAKFETSVMMTPLQPFKVAALEKLIVI
jgi:hypothetical protein